MLNLFSYTALFSVHAVRRGITGAVNVDLSRAVLERAKVNYGLNGLRIDERDFIYGDSLEWIRRFRKKGRTFSFVIFDPPTFSRNRQRSFSSRRDYAASPVNAGRPRARGPRPDIGQFLLDIGRGVPLVPSGLVEA